MRYIHTFVKKGVIEDALKLLDEGKVKDVKKVGTFDYTAKVEVSKDEVLDVELNLDKILGSKCGCHECEKNAKTFCVHKVAVFFAVDHETAEYYRNKK